MGIEELSDKALRERAGYSQHELARRFKLAGYACSQAQISLIESGKMVAPADYRLALESTISGARTEMVAVCWTCNKPHSLDNCHGKMGELVILGPDEAIVTVKPGVPVAEGPRRPPRDRHSVSMTPEDFMRFNSARIQFNLTWAQLIERGIEMCRRSAWFDPAAVASD